MSLKEDEKEVLAHIVQNIDEQEIFLEFVAKAETIKEAWQIAKIFENKKKEFTQSLQEYDMLIKAKEKQLKNLTDEITEANTLLKDANAELEHIKAQLEEMQAKAQFYKNKILQGKQSEQAEHDSQAHFMLVKDEGETNLLDFSNIIAEFQPLNVVSVHVKNGATAMARVAQTIYPPELHEAYKRAGKRLFRLKDKIGELELNNEKLRVELRDLTEEYNFKEHVQSEMGDIADDYSPIIDAKMPPKTKLNSNTPAQSHHDSFTKHDTFLNHEIPENKNHADRMTHIEEKKKRVEEMLSQLSSVLQEEGVSAKNTDDFIRAFREKNK